MEIARLRLEQLEDQTFADPEAVLEAQQVLVQVRELSPMVGLSHFMIGRRQETFQRADSSLEYYLRAGLSRPMDPTLAYLTGAAQLDASDTEAATESFRRSLALSTRHLGEVLEKSASSLSQETLNSLLPPDNHQAFIEAANWLEARQKSNGTLEFDSIIRSLRASALETRELKFANNENLCQIASQLHLQLGEKAKATEALNLALRYAPRGPRSSRIAIQLARIYASDEQFREAKEAIGEGLDRDRSNPTLQRLYKEYSRAALQGRRRDR